jgi:hypothetical protein
MANEKTLAERSKAIQETLSKPVPKFSEDVAPEIHDYKDNRICLIVGSDTFSKIMEAVEAALHSGELFELMRAYSSYGQYKGAQAIVAETEERHQPVISLTTSQAQEVVDQLCCQEADHKTICAAIGSLSVQLGEHLGWNEEQQSFGGAE